MSMWIPQLADALKMHPAVCLVTVLEVHGSAPRAAGAKMIVAPDNSIAGSIGGGNLEEEARRHALDLLADVAAGEPGSTLSSQRYRLCPQVHQCCGGTVRVLFEVLVPPVPLVIFGAGHVAGEIADVVRGLDFSVTVVDERLDWNSPDRFPHCRRVTTDAVEFARALRTGWTLVMTHDHDLDFRLLEVLLRAPLDYVGLIGSATKRRKAIARLDPALTPKLVSPIGLMIGGKTPREIAISVAAQLISLRNGATEGLPTPEAEDALEASESHESHNPA
jgi:xanthine dehydrogenase accessory factor